jgi:hypothetical protein
MGVVLARDCTTVLHQNFAGTLKTKLGILDLWIEIVENERSLRERLSDINGLSHRRI